MIIQGQEISLNFLLANINSKHGGLREVIIHPIRVDMAVILSAF